MEKKAKQFDRIVGEWKQKVDSLSMDLDVAQKETRNVSSELFRVKNAYDESILQLEEVRRENKSYKKQIEEAEEIAALNLAKYRQVQGNLQQSGERADLQEQALAKMKASSRAGSLAPM